ncbi:pulmonary surfactant-associated protein D-like [Cavia porcellus]|uniref:pulmonary surfactant-associated protein D-like n=1 Tax=Cavia porcellus TaxID=10141 RepID=UPI002FE39644
MATPRFQGSLGAGLAPRGAQGPLGSPWAPKGRLLPEAAEPEAAAVGPGGCRNPRGAAGLRALPAAGTGSWCRRNRAGPAAARTGCGPVGGRRRPAPRLSRLPAGLPTGLEAGAEAAAPPQARSRLPEPTSAETKVTKDSANTRKTEDTWM